MKIKVSDRKNIRELKHRGLNANFFVAVILTAVVSVGVITVFLGVAFSKYGIKGDILCYLTAVVCALIAFILDRIFCWFPQQWFYEYGGNAVYEYDSCVDVFGHKEGIATILTANKIKKRGRNLILYGDIIVKEPMMKSKNVNKIVFYDYTKETYEFLVGYFHL